MININSRMTGFADEASQNLSRQIELHTLLGWPSIELRNVDGVNICEMDDAKFLEVEKELKENSMRAACFGSSLCNWARPITTPFEKDIQDLRRAIPRMRALDTKLIRIMSYPNDNLSQNDWKKETFRRVKELITIAEGEGVTLALENCDGWAVQSPSHFSEFMETLKSPSLKVIFDPGNPISHGGTSDEVWAYYLAALPYIVHFHIKDCKIVDNTPEHQYVGEGDCDNEIILKDLISRGYNGMFSIEPHLHKPYNEGMYFKYGQMANEMISHLL